MTDSARSTERVPLIPGVLRVSMLGDASGIFEGDVCDVSCRGVGVHLLPDRLPALREGQETVLTFHRPGTQQYIVARATLRHTVAQAGGVHFGFEFQKPQALRNQIQRAQRSNMCALFNARSATRVELDPATPLMALLSGQSQPQQKLARIANLSMSGLAVEYATGSLGDLAQAEQLSISFPNPSDGKPLSFHCRARGRRGLGAQELLGLEFEPAGDAEFEPKRAALQASCVALQTDYLMQASKSA